MNSRKLLGLPFLCALFLLLLNDQVLKATFHNTLTGILSDFSGLFAFAWFFSALFQKQKLHIHICVALLFVWWKSPLSEAFIQAFSNQLYPIHRVVDYWDLLALLILPLSFTLLDRNRLELPLNWLKIPIAALTIYSFMATSIYTGIPAIRSTSDQKLKEKLDQQEHITYQFIHQTDSIIQPSIHWAYTLQQPTNAEHPFELRSIVDSLIISTSDQLQLSVDLENTKYSFGLRKVPRAVEFEEKDYWILPQNAVIAEQNGTTVNQIEFDRLTHRDKKKLKKFLPLIEALGLEIDTYPSRNYSYPNYFTSSIDTVYSTRVFQDEKLFEAYEKWKNDPKQYNSQEKVNKRLKKLMKD